MTRSTTHPASRDELTDAAADAAIEQACRILRLPTIRSQHARIAEAANASSVRRPLARSSARSCREHLPLARGRALTQCRERGPEHLDDLLCAHRGQTP